MPALFDAADLPRPAREIRPGVVHLPAALDPATQAVLVNQGREIARGVAGTPVGMHRPRLRGGQMSVHVLSLGHHWATDPRRLLRTVAGHAVPPVPENHRQLAADLLHRAARLSPALAPWVEGFRAEGALLNYYPPGARMGMHIDADEPSGAPVVSLSIGDTAIFRMGNTHNRNQPWTDIALLSGDVIIFGGPARRAYHGVPAVRPGTAPVGCGLREGRINITIRQVAE